MPATRISNGTSPYQDDTYSLIDTGPAFGMPTLELAVEALTCIKDPVIVILIMDRPCQAVSKHALCQRRQGLYWVLFKKGSCC